MAREEIDFRDLLDVAATLDEELKTVRGRSVQVILLTDSKGIFYVISKSYRTSEKMIILKITFAR